jgi:hypothetical protein
MLEVVAELEKLGKKLSEQLKSEREINEKLVKTNEMLEERLSEAEEKITFLLESMVKQIEFTNELQEVFEDFMKTMLLNPSNWQYAHASFVKEVLKA